MAIPIVSQIDVDLDKVVSNYRTVCSFVSPAVLIAAVKTNAYSHGAVAIARTLVSAGCRHLAVAKLMEAVQLRSAGITPEAANLIIMSALLPEEIEVAVEIGASIFVPDLARLEHLKGVARGRKRPVGFHLKVDTGLGRLGVMPNEAPQVTRAIRNLGNCRLEGIGTHLSASREDTDQNARQLERFDRFVAEVQPPADCLLHMANSAATLRFPAMRKTAVRIGYLIYGLVIVKDPPIHLDPVLSFRSRVTQVKDLPHGWHVGYGTKKFVKEPIRTATIAIGTGDGLLLTQINRAILLVNGKRCKLLGASSDMAIINVTEAGSVQVGDEVIYIGIQAGEEISAIEQRDAAGVGVADLLTSLRVPRRYVRSGAIIGEMSQYGVTGIADPESR